MTIARPTAKRTVPPTLARTGLRASACAAVLALAACASPPSNFYTLSGSDAATGATAAVPTAAAASNTANPSLLIEVAPVDVPPQDAKNQMVVQTGPTQVKVLEDERWASLPGDEIRRALSASLTQQLNTIDVYGTAYTPGKAAYRVSMNVQRFESWPGSHALIDAVWSVRSLRSQAVMTCRSVVQEPVSSGYAALAGGHRLAVQEISTQIAGAVRAFDSIPQAAMSTTTGKSASGSASSPSPATPPCPMTGASAAPSASAIGIGGRSNG
ncbi:PqiC family protein [Paraburkholderia sp.]|uniref:PqiC family protein n=1 Tax=Paraburkholderia sp. TaxID=1926495 RepID=UPI002395CCD9|nr:PqiC family protein [Paraburkholderia sp.]MDE1183350.1 PqiC family protein [Paraburkholderia sp.]